MQQLLTWNQFVFRPKMKFIIERSSSRCLKQGEGQMTRFLPGLRAWSESEEGPSPAAPWRRRRSPAEGKVRGAVPQRAEDARHRREAQACRCSRRSIIGGGSRGGEARRW